MSERMWDFGNEDDEDVEHNPNPLGGDSKKDIYIHSKVILIDEAFGIVGSANHNERSMYHDSEDALAFRSSARYNIVRNIRNELMAIALSGDLPETFDGHKIFKHFEKHLEINSSSNEPISLVYPLVPKAGFGITVMS